MNKSPCILVIKNDRPIKYRLFRSTLVQARIQGGASGALAPGASLRGRQNQPEVKKILFFILAEEINFLVLKSKLKNGNMINPHYAKNSHIQPWGGAIMNFCPGQKKSQIRACPSEVDFRRYLTDFLTKCKELDER